jgi:hypothetical protein
LNRLFLGKDLSQELPPPTTPRKRTGYPIAAGILTIIASCLTLYFGIRFFRAVGLFWVLMGIFGILAFAFGLTAGIFSIRRRRYGLSIFGMSLLTFMGFLMLLVPASFSALLTALLFGLPLLILSILSVVFAAMSKDEFT